MSDQPDFDFEGVFDSDYFYFYADLLTPERSDREAESIARLLDVKPGDRILDAPCGHGRIASRLAARGFSVTGLDASEPYLDVARSGAAAGAEYVRGDLRSLPWTAEFDAAVNWFTSFGYFDDDTNRHVLAEYRRALKPGGRLLIEHLNRDRIIRNLPDASLPARVVVHERNSDIMIDQITFDAINGRTRTERTIVRGGSVRRTVFTVRVLTFPELRDWLLDAGFSSVDAFGPDEEAFSMYSDRMLAVARA